MREGARLRGLYVITPRERDTGRLAGLVRASLEGGAAAVQYRAKDARPDEARAQVGFHRPEQALLGEGLGEVLVAADHAPARAVEQAVLRRQHDHRGRLVLAALLDQRAGLVAVQARHHDVDEDEVGLVVGDLRQRVEAVLREDDLAARLHEEDLGAAPDGVAVVDHHHAYAGEVLGVRHAVLRINRQAPGQKPKPPKPGWRKRRAGDGGP